MSYTLQFHPDLKGDLKALPKHIQTVMLNDYFPHLQSNPHAGKSLTGVLTGLYSCAVKFLGTQYRVAYRIIESDSVVFVFMVGTREGFYDRLK